MQNRQICKEFCWNFGFEENLRIKIPSLRTCSLAWRMFLLNCPGSSRTRKMQLIRRKTMERPATTEVSKYVREKKSGLRDAPSSSVCLCVCVCVRVFVSVGFLFVSSYRKRPVGHSKIYFSNCCYWNKYCWIVCSHTQWTSAYASKLYAYI